MPGLEDGITLMATGLGMMDQHLISPTGPLESQMEQSGPVDSRRESICMAERDHTQDQTLSSGMMRIPPFGSLA